MFRVASGFYHEQAQAVVLPPHKGKDMLVASLLTGVLIGSLLFISPLADRLHVIARESTDVQAYIDRVQPVRMAPIEVAGVQP